jgi:hypothetical protein
MNTKRYQGSIDTAGLLFAGVCGAIYMLAPAVALEPSLSLDMAISLLLAFPLFALVSALVAVVIVLPYWFALRRVGISSEAYGTSGIALLSAVGALLLLRLFAPRFEASLQVSALVGGWAACTYLPFCLWQRTDKSQQCDQLPAAAVH